MFDREFCLLRTVGLLCATVALISGCATASGESPSFLQGVQQTLGAASMLVGVRVGDDSLSQSGADMLTQGLVGNSSGSTETGNAVRATQTNVAGNSDSQDIAKRCDAKASLHFGTDTQNQILMRTACIQYCAWNATGVQQLYAAYKQNQDSANGLCQLGRTSSNCNDIRPTVNCVL